MTLWIYVEGKKNNRLLACYNQYDTKLDEYFVGELVSLIPNYKLQIYHIFLVVTE